MAAEPKVGARVRVCHSDGYWYYGSLESNDKKGKLSVAFDDGDKIVVALPHRDIQVLAAGALPCSTALDGSARTLHSACCLQKLDARRRWLGLGSPIRIQERTGARWGIARSKQLFTAASKSAAPSSRSSGTLRRSPKICQALPVPMSQCQRFRIRLEVMAHPAATAAAPTAAAAAWCIAAGVWLQTTMCLMLSA